MSDDADSDGSRWRDEPHEETELEEGGPVEQESSRATALRSARSLAGLVVGLAVVGALSALGIWLVVVLVDGDGDADDTTEQPGLMLVNETPERVVVVERAEEPASENVVAVLEANEELEVSDRLTLEEGCTVHDLVAMDPDRAELGRLEAGVCVEEPNRWVAAG